MRTDHMLMAIFAALAMLCGSAMAQDAGPAAEPDNGESAPAEPAAETSDETDAPKADEDTFHIDLEGLDDLPETDIVLPDLDDDMGVPEPTTPAEPSDADTVEPAPAAEAEDDAPDAADGGDEPKEPVDPMVLVRQIIDGMDDSADRLAEKVDPGEDTQQVQGKVVDDLSELIKYVKRQQAQQQQQQQDQQQQSKKDEQKARERRRRQQQRQQQQQQQSQRQQPQRPQEAMQDEQATHGQAQEADPEEVSKLLEERWGDLLKNAPKETRQAIPNMILPKYRELLSRYFFALAQQAAERQRDGDEQE